MYPPVEASGGQEQYYVSVRSAWQFQELNWGGRLQSDLLSLDVTPLVEASGGKEQYYIGSAWNVQSNVR